MEIDQNLKALCLEILSDNVGSDRFNMLLLQTGVRLDTIEWDVANKMLGKGDTIQHALRCVRITLQ